MSESTELGAAYIVEQAVGIFAFLLLSLAFLTQILVEKKAKYDERQLTQRQRVEDWKKLATGPKRKRRRSSVSRMISQYRKQQTDQQQQQAAANQPQVGSRRNSIDPPSSNSKQKVPGTSTPNWYIGARPSVPSQSENGPVELGVRPNNRSRPSSARPSVVDGAVTVTVNTAPTVDIKPAKTIRVGMLQLVLHRLGLAASVVQLAHYVDPYSIHGIFPFAINALLDFISQGILFSAAIFTFLYPLHLIRVMSLDNGSSSLLLVGSGLSIATMLISIAIPIAFALVDSYNFLRAVVIIWFIFALVVITVVHNYYSPGLIESIEKLIAFHAKGPGKVFRASIADPNAPAGPPSTDASKTNSVLTGPSPAASRDAQPVTGTIVRMPSDDKYETSVSKPSVAPLLLLHPSGTSSEPPTDRDYTNHGSGTASPVLTERALLATSGTTSTLASNGSGQSGDLNDEKTNGQRAAEEDGEGDEKSTASVSENHTKNVEGSDSDAESDTYADDDIGLSPSSPAGRHVQKKGSHDNLSDGGIISPSIRSREGSMCSTTALIKPLNQQVPSLALPADPSATAAAAVARTQLDRVAERGNMYTVSEAVVSINERASAPAPVPPPARASVNFNTKPTAGLVDYQVAGARREASVSRTLTKSKSRKRRAAKNPVIRQYTQLISQLKLFRVVGNVLVIFALAALCYYLKTLMEDPMITYSAPPGDDFRDSIHWFVLSAVVFLGLLLAFWFAYVPGSIAYLLSIKSAYSKSAISPNSANRNNNLSPNLPPVVERRLSFHSITPPRSPDRNLPATASLADAMSSPGRGEALV